MKNKKMPLYGVGPYYVAIIILLTCVGIFISKTDLLVNGYIDSLRIPLIIIGVGVIILGIILWICSVFKSKIDKNIEANKLVTTGVYAWCRNPIYTAFMMFCTAACLINGNLWLLILPFIYWALLVLFMKNTEEKWLLSAFGDEYVEYCKKVNRCIPWFPKK